MKNNSEMIPAKAIGGGRTWLVLLTAVLATSWAVTCPGVPPRSVVAAAAEQNENAAAPAEETSVQKRTVIVEKTEPASEDEPVAKMQTWLGISSAEAADALAAQLDLQPGVGLVVTYVAPDSPAAKAGLQKNDVLVTFEGQSLVHPAQLRKLVRSRKTGDTVKLEFYRTGRQRSVSVILDQKEVVAGPFDQEQRQLEEGLHQLQKQFKDMHLDVVIRDQMKAARDALGNIKIDQHKVQEDIRHGMDEARKSIREALRSVTNTDPALGPVKKLLEDLAGSGVVVDNNASVTVRSSGKGVKSLVNTDDSGTIVIVSQPKLHLTAHDKDGHLLFDGEIETADQRSKVPHDLWERVEPLLDKLNATTAEEPEAKEAQ